MLPRTARLKKRDISRVYKKARRLNRDFLAVKFLPNAAKSSRYAVVIPKAVVKLSTHRSRLKRKTMETIAAHQSDLKANYDIILSFRRAPAETALAPAIQEILKSINQF